LAVALNKGRMNDNRTHTFVQSYLLELPFGRGKKWATGGTSAWILGGWQFQGILSMMTGQWVSPSIAAANLNAPGNASRPDWVAPLRYPSLIGPGVKFFDPSAFRSSLQNTLGNAGRNIIQGPGLVNLDASIHREFRLREGMGLELRVESFNFSNTPHFQDPNTNFNSPQFGEVNGAEQDQRQYQLALTFRF
jgi:hypothetical protein